MNIVFFGSSKFAVKSLDAILEAGHRVNLVVTQPDKPKGRHLFYSSTDVKERSKELKLNIYQPDDPSGQRAIDTIRKVQADLFIVISYGHILKNSILGLPKLYSLNVHASLLPKYRGAAPINWAIIKGEKETGLSVIRMNEKMDCGDILLQKGLKIENNDNAVTLQDKLSFLAALSIVEAVSLIEHRQEQFMKQDDSCASLAPKLKKDDGLIDWNGSCEDIVNQIRGLLPWPTAFTYLDGKLLKIFAARISGEAEGEAGKISALTKEGIIIAAGRGTVEILEVQLASEKRMAAGAFLCGHRLVIGNKLG